MMKRCHFCGGQVVRRQVRVDFRWGARLKVIEGVPAGVCRQCGERYVEAADYKDMEALARSSDAPAARLTVDVMRFRRAG
jgi:YgiT-type zinc finger domain-containing protein